MEIEEDILEPVINNDYPSNIDNISDISNDNSIIEEIKKIDTINEDHIEPVCEPVEEHIEPVCEQIEPICESIEEPVEEKIEEHIEPVEEKIEEQIEPVEEKIEEQIEPVCESIKIVSIEELTEEILPLEDKEVELVCTPIVKLKDVVENTIQLLPLEKTIVDKLIKSLESNKIENELILIVSLMELIELEKSLNKNNSFINILNYMYTLIEKDNRIDLIALVKLVELKDKMNVNSFAKIVCDSSKGKLNINKKKNWLCNLLKF